MSRVIKYRAWNRQTSKMIDLKAITPFALDPGLHQDGLFLPFAEDYVLEQFTGLLDSTGREIYEGDIVEPDYFYSGQPDKRWPNLVVEYSDQMGAFFLNEYWETKLGRLRSANGSHIIHGGPAISRGRVVGHIHQVEPINL